MMTAPDHCRRGQRRCVIVGIAIATTLTCACSPSTLFGDGGRTALGTTSASPPPGFQSEGKIEPFTVPIVQEHGYRRPLGQPGTDPSIYNSKPEALHTQWNDCTVTSQNQLDAEVPSAMPDADRDALLNDFTVDASGPELQEAAAQWHSCMAP